MAVAIAPVWPGLLESDAGIPLFDGVAGTRVGGQLLDGAAGGSHPPCLPLLCFPGLGVVLPSIIRRGPHRPIG